LLLTSLNTYRDYFTTLRLHDRYGPFKFHLIHLLNLKHKFETGFYFYFKSISLPDAPPGTHLVPIEIRLYFQ
jgi:hypothetical protein